MEIKNKSLLDITKEYREIEEKLIDSNGEIDDNLELFLAEKTQALTTKIDACVYIIERLKEGESYFKSKADQYNRLAKSHAMAELRLKDRIKFVMNTTENNELLGEENKFKLTGGRSRLVIEDEKKIPQEFIKTITTVESFPDKELIETAINNGIEVPGTHKEEVWSLRILKNKRV